MRLIAPLMVWLGLAGQVAALSCMPTDARRTFVDLSQVEQPYHILLGTLDFDVDLLPEVPEGEVGQTVAIPARFEGLGLTTSGFTVRSDRSVTLVSECLGPWCAGAVPGARAVFFAAVDGGATTITAMPCGGHIFYDPADDLLEDLRVCIAGGPCEAPELF